MFMQKLTTIVRGSVRESADLIIDANAVRIFEQEICDCETGIRNAKAGLTVVVAEKIKLQRQIQQSQQTIRMREEQAIEAINKQFGDLPEQLAEAIAEEEAMLAQMQTSLAKLAQQEASLTQSLKATINKVQSYRRELELAKATERSQRARHSLHGQRHQTDLSATQESLQRIKAKQQRFDDQLAAQQQVHSELSGGGLDAQLKQQGIGQQDKAKAVLQRLQAKARQ